MKVLVINCGSSSVKYQLIDGDSEKCLAKGQVSRIGVSGALLQHKAAEKEEVARTGEILDHIQAIAEVVKILTSEKHGVIKNTSEISAVGHRVVHGGEQFGDSVLITPAVMSTLRSLIELAPLHNPHNIRGIIACERTLPDVPQVAVFDTAMHCKMPRHAYIYGLPYVLYKRYGIRRYGFHGMSHHYVAHRSAALLGKPLKDLKMITAHLGNGASVTAVKDGISIDTSMGFTPLEGLLMGTRTGDIDAAIILYLMGREELSMQEASTLMNKHSGLSGVSQVSSDMREIEKALSEGHEQAKLAHDIYCYRLKKYIGAYAAAMGGLDVVVFTAGVGENSPLVRSKSCQGLEFLGLKIDEAKNQAAKAVEADIATDDSRVRVTVIPTNEELVIARDAKAIVEKIK